MLVETGSPRGESIEAREERKVLVRGGKQKPPAGKDLQIQAKEDT